MFMSFRFLGKPNGINATFCLCCICLCIAKVQSDRHRLLYMYSAFIRPNGSSEFSAVGLYDDRRFSHYSNEQKTWKRDDLDSDIWRYTAEPPESKNWFLNEIKILANCTQSRCDGLHTLQMRIGCEFDAAMEVNVFDEFGFDGEDFIAFNFTSMQWMEKNPQAKETKLRWNKHSSRNQDLKTHLNNCTKYISTVNASVTSPPDVHMFASAAPHEQHELNLTCLATGFYPKHTEMKITLNNELLPFISTGIRPNNNQTFQMRVSVTINPDQRDGYECHVNHSQTGTHTTSWDGNCTNYSKESTGLVLAAVAAGFFAVVVLSVVLIICKRRKLNVNPTVAARSTWDTSGSTDLLNASVEQPLTNLILVEFQSELCNICPRSVF